MERLVSRETVMLPRVGSQETKVWFYQNCHALQDRHRQDGHSQWSPSSVEMDDFFFY